MILSLYYCRSHYAQKLINPLTKILSRLIMLQGIQIYIEIQDRDDDTADDFVDVILINHTAPVGINSGRRNYTGVFGFVSMVLSSTVLCAPNFQGTDCTQCTRAGFTGPNCADQISINDCVGVDCGNGVCVNGLNSYSCTCDPGFTGEFCRTNIPNIPSGKRESERERERERERE